MRSGPWTALALLLAACTSAPGTADVADAGGVLPGPDPCQSDYLRYENFGAPFLSDWCRGCHSASLTAEQRQHAPLGIDFDSVADVRKRTASILQQATGTGPNMPPAGGPGPEERELLRRWLSCGAP